MDIKKHIKKINNVSTLSALAIGFVAGLVVMYLYFQPHLFFQGKTAKDWSNLATENMNTTQEYSQKLSDLNKKYASVSAALQILLNAPTPTPKVQYIDKTPSRPNLSSCTLEGNFYFCPADNCYYNPNGTPTGECKIPPMGGF
jgi:hypothetical protein